MSKKKPTYKQDGALTLDDLEKAGVRYYGVGMDAPPATNEVEQEKPSGGLGRLARDTGVGLLKGAAGLPEAVVGMADLVTGGHAGQLAERAGVRFKDAQGILDTWYSPETQAAKQEFQQAEGIGGKLAAAVSNPSVVGTAVLESLPQMGGGAVVARGLMRAAPTMSALRAGAIGEGVLGAGSSAEGIRQQTEDGLLTGQQAGLAALSGVGTAAFGAAGGKLAQRLGIGDVDTMLAAGSRSAGMGTAAVEKGVTRRFLEGAVSEGFLEELPQSVQEQVLQNAALGRPLEEGVDGAAVLGTLSGMAMGGPAGALSTPATAQPAPAPIVPPAGPLTRAANAGAAVTPPAPAPVPVTPEQEQALLAHANRRFRELEEKANGTKDEKITGEDGKPVTVPGKQPEFLTPAEKEEREFLSANGGDAQALAKAYKIPAAPAPTATEQPGNLAGLQADAAETAPTQSGNLAELAQPAPEPAPEAATAPAKPQGPAFASLDEADDYVTAKMKRGGGVSGVPVQNEDGSIALVDKKDPRYTQAQLERQARKKARAQAAKTKEPVNDPAGDAAQPGATDAGAVPGAASLGGEPADLGAVRGADAAVTAGGVSAGEGAAGSGRGNRNDALTPSTQPQPTTLGAAPIQAQPAGTRGTTAADIIKKAPPAEQKVQPTAQIPQEQAPAEQKAQAPTADPAATWNSASEQERADIMMASGWLSPKSKPVQRATKMAWDKLSEPQRAKIAQGLAKRSANAQAAPEGAGTPAQEAPADQTRAAEGADAARAEQQPVDAGARGAEVEADGVKPMASASGQRSRSRGRDIDPQRDTLLQAIAKLGGIGRDRLSRFGLRPEELSHQVRIGNLKAHPFRKAGGSDLDSMLERLVEAGYLYGANPDDRMAALEEAVKDELGGLREHRTAEGEAFSAQQRDAEDRADYEAEISADEEAERAAIMAADNDLSLLEQAADDDILDLDALGKTDIASILRAMGASEQEISDELAKEAARTGRKGTAGQGAGEATAGKAPPAAGAGSQEARALPADEGLGTNTVFTEDAAEKARAILRAKLGGGNKQRGGIDPEVFTAGLTLAGYHIEKGARKFAAYARAMVDDLGDVVKPYLKSWYMGVKYDPRGAGLDGMDSAADVEAADVDAILAPEAKDEAPASDKPSTAGPEGRMAVAQNVADHLIGGNKFATIVEARKFIEELTGSRIVPGTIQAKHADEAIELGVVLAARDIVRGARKQGRSDEVIYKRLVDLYQAQPNLAVRTSTSVREQAYSTPVPLAFLASRLAGVTADAKVGEPTAGNGALLIEVAPKNATANELNADRLASLRSQGFEPTQNNAATSDLAPAKSLDVVLQNPPFGAVKDGQGETIYWDVLPGFKTREIDHAIVFKSLEAMKDDGTAVLIVGGVDKSDPEAIREEYRGQNKRNFYFHLYKQYGVVDHFTVDGDLYTKQGAGYPVDVIVIRGRGEGKSTRPLPAASLPERIASWDALKEKLNAQQADSLVPTGTSPGTGRGDGAAGTSDRGDVAGSPAASPGPAGDQASQASAGSRQSGGRTGSQSSGSRGSAAGQQLGAEGVASQQPGGQRDGVAPAGARDGRSGRAAAGSDAAGLGGSSQGADERVGSELTDRRGKEAETATQVAYSPRSEKASVGTLVPRAMQGAIEASLDRVKEEVGSLDAYVADALGYDQGKLGNYFSAEQIDALALAIYNAQRDSGFIIGDQTGIGKGRVVAAMIRYALRSGKTPVFVTEKPNLYADMIRDLDDIGMATELGLETEQPAIFMTNSAEAIPYVLIRGSGENLREVDLKLKAPSGKKMDELLAAAIESGSKGMGRFKVVFTTYNQLQTVKGKVTDRMRAVQALANGGYVILDESHNAGGAGDTQARTTEQRNAAKEGRSLVTGRAAFVRTLVANSKGSFFSSATYAKRPDVMDLYSSTNMLLAVDKPSQLGPAIKEGGVPMQQIVATMLTEDGQYIRRERTFAGVSYDTRPMPVDKQTAENMAKSMSMVLAFSRAKEAAIKAMQKEFDKEGAIATEIGGEKTSVQGANFGSIMHNLIDQMLLSLKAKSAVDVAVERLKAGEKVVLTVSNTMGSFLAEFAADMGIRPGEPVVLSFKDLYQRYLEKQRLVKIKRPGGVPVEHRLSDKELGDHALAMFKAAQEFIEGAGFGKAPISPIDYMRQELEALGYKTDEITGRSLTISYRAGTPVLATRKAGIKERLAAIRGFNGGDLDVLVLNQSGSTGLSLHASEKVKDKRKRHMVVVQPEKNIDTHMQMLGRVHRTGQVVTPAYTQAMADIPAELRPAAVLAKKMAGLNANTTASRKSAVSAEGVVDFMNEYGGQVAAQFLMDNPDIHAALGGNKVLPLPTDIQDAGEDLVRKLTGYIPILPIAQQEALYEDLMERYNDLIEQENALGTNKLEAKALDLDAKTIKREQLTEDKRQAGKSSRFAEPAFMEQVDVKRLVQPLPLAEVDALIASGLAGKDARTFANDLIAQARTAHDEMAAGLRAKLTGDEDALRLQSALGTIQLQKDRIVTVLSTYPVGSPLTMTDKDGNITHGVVTGYGRGKSTKNPLAGSSWKMNVALADGEARSISLPFSKLDGEQVKLRVETGTIPAVANDGSTEWVRIRDLFDRGGNVRREKRWVVTGNILAGYAKYPGQIVTFTRGDGTTTQGVLMRRAFDYDKLKQGAKLTFSKSDQILQFFKEAGRGATITTSDGVLRLVSEGGGSANIITSSSKREGGRFFLDRGLTDAMGTDFVKSGGNMRAKLWADQDIRSTLEYLLNDSDVSLVSGTHADVARKVLGLGDAPADSGDARFSRRRSGAGVPMRDAESAADLIRREFPGGPQLNLLESVDDAPAELRRQIIARGAQNNVEAVYWDGQIYAFPGHLANLDRFMFVVGRHEVRHAGWDAMLGDQKDAIMLSIGRANRRIALKAQKLVRDGIAESFTEAVEEVLADTKVEDVAALSRIQVAVSAIRRWLRATAARLRRAGWNKLADSIEPKTWSDNDVLAFVLKAEDFNRGPGGGGLRFSRDAEPNKQEARALAELAKHDDLFAIPKSNALLPKDIAHDIDQGIVVQKMMTPPGHTEAYKVIMPSGSEAKLYVRAPNPFGSTLYGFDMNEGEMVSVYEGRPGENPDDVDPDTQDVYIDASKLTGKGEGQKLYALAGAFAHNTGRIFIGDPAGLSDDALRRRPENMLSLALKYGTTKFLAPHPRQIVGAPSLGVPPLKWVYGDDVGNLHRLIALNTAAVENGFPDAKKIEFDLATGTFRNVLTGQRVSMAALGRRIDQRGREDAGNGGPTGAAKAGSRTLARAVLFRALAAQASGGNGSGDGRPAGVLDALSDASRVHAKGELKALFSRATPERLRDAAMRGKEAVRDLNLIAGYKAGDFLQSTGKLSWWDKSVGTPYNLAQRSPEFARVYDAVQSFLSDVSFYAKEAANLAPRLLPDLDKLSDLKKKPISPADNKAVAAPIFEGTLGWTRDESGKPITMEEAEAAAEQMSADDKAHKLLRDKELDPGVLRMWQGQELDRYEAMVNTRYASVYLRPGVVWSDNELRSKFKLTDEQIGLYKEFRAAVDRSLDDLAAAEIRRLTRDTLGDVPMEEGQDVDAWAMAVRDRLFEADDNATADQVVKIANRLKDLKAHGYAPLSRFGHFTVDVMKDGERVYFGMYESQAEANRAARKLAGDFPGADITEGTMSTEGYKQFAGVSPETLALFGEAMGLDKDTVYQEYLKRAVATRSALKRLIHRQGIAGFSEDVGRVLAGFITSNARRASSQDHMGEIGEATEAIPKEQGDLKDYAIKFGEYVSNPTEEAQAIRGVMFAQYLGGSISSALVNMTQPFTVAFPYLSQFGGVAKAGAALTKAMKDMASSAKLEDDLAQAMKRAEEDGVVAPQEIHQLMAQARGVGGLQSGDGTKAGDAAATVQNHFSRLQLVWGKLFSFAEMTNRRMTYIAAYRMAKANGNPDPDAFARKAINETMFVMNKGNRPKWARGAIGATLFTFKSYMVSYLELMARMYRQGGPEGKKAFWLGLAVLLVMGGGDELPFMENIEDLIDGFAQNVLGLNWQTKAKRHEVMADLLGKDLAEFLNRGVSSIGPIDVTGRFGMGSPIPGTGLFRRDTQDTGRDWAQILGPVGDLVPRMVKAGGMALRGDIGQAAMEAAPVAVRNVAKGADMLDTGMYRDTQGRKVIETDAADALAKMAGFQPAEVGQVQSASVTSQRMIALNKSVETQIADLWAKGRFENDPAKVDEARKKLREWNEQNPDSPIRIKPGQIQQRVKKMREPKAERLAKTAPKELRESVRRDLTEANQ